MKLSDYIVEFLEEKGVVDCFTVVGGGAMHLNNSFGHAKKIKCTHFHHEQGAAMAAESYSRYDGKVAALCVTSGPGGTNAITGVLGGWLDSLPMFVVSGQVRYDTTARFNEKWLAEKAQGSCLHSLRSLGDQEYDITRMVGNICKYAVMVENPADIRYHLEKAWHLMKEGRPGPVWIDIPVNFQAANVEPQELRSFEDEEKSSGQSESFADKISDDVIQSILDDIQNAKRPVIYAGGGVRIAGAFSEFREMVSRLGVPVCTYWDSIDLMETDDELYCGRGGNMGDRPGNFAVQNSDLCLVIGSRLSIRQVGYSFDTWARAAKVIMVDIDEAEMSKHTIHVDKKVVADAKVFCQKMNEKLKCLASERQEASKNCSDEKIFSGKKNSDFFCCAENWRKQCLAWKQKYPVVSETQKDTGEGLVNVYGFIDALSGLLPEGSLTAVSNGACCVAGHQSYIIKKGTRFIINNAVASMGYGLPAAIGLCIVAGKKRTVCLEGDGSIMMNLQELQTIITNNLPISVFLINNEGYHSIRLTQNNVFPEYSKVGIGPESGDLSFPEFESIAKAFGYKYISVRKGKELVDKLKEALNQEGPVFCEVFTDTVQVWAPKSSVKKETDGTLTSPPLEDLAPFLSREELKENMFI